MKVLVCMLAVLMSGGCSSMLPSSKQEDSNRWRDFEDAKKSYDLIIPYETNMDTVRKLGFDPFKTPNTQILNYSQVVRAVVPSPIQEQTSIPKGIIDCMKMQEGCVGYLVEPSRVKRQRVGNFMLDFMNFKRDTHTSGWKFSALIVVIDNLVVYKQWSGSPQIDQNETRRNPLGPLQGVGESYKPPLP